MLENLKTDNCGRTRRTVIFNRFIHPLNGGILPNLPDKCANFTFLSIGLLKHSHQFLQTALIFFLFLFHSGSQLHKSPF